MMKGPCGLPDGQTLVSNLSRIQKEEVPVVLGELAAAHLFPIVKPGAYFESEGSDIRTMA